MPPQPRRSLKHGGKTGFGLQIINLSSQSKIPHNDMAGFCLAMTRKDCLSTAG